MPPAITSTPEYASLREKERARRDGWPQPFRLRVHRAVSWLGRAEQMVDDTDIAFILLWIAVNAAYADLQDVEALDERGLFARFAGDLVGFDGAHRIYETVWGRFSQEIRLLLDNRFVFRPFWDHHNSGGAVAGDWRQRLERERRRVHRALKEEETAVILVHLFNRLYVLRNQIVHGGATWGSSANRAQVKDGARVLGRLAPVFVDVMMDHPDHDWGRPAYPVVD
ncbi:MAG: hypothetical protein ACRED9_15340 [Caulobacteraceae bacterium]